jgi:hypothetical protein
MNNKEDLKKSTTDRRKFIKSAAILSSGIYLTRLASNFREEPELKKPIISLGDDTSANLPHQRSGDGKSNLKGGFVVRATQDTGWNIFLRKGSSRLASDIDVNYRHLDFLHEAGINWLLVFWTNAPEFKDAWIKASEHAHKLGLHLARAVYGFGGGGIETSMAEPNVPEHLLKPSKKGAGTALCPFDPEAREWVANSMYDRIQPDVDGIIIEPARETSRSCICERCSSLRPFEWDTLVINFIAGKLLSIKPGTEIMLHLSAVQATRETKRMMSADLGGLRKEVRHIFGWGTDDEESLTDWLDADPRFDAFTKISRVILFPGGTKPSASAEDRVARAFNWCRLAADRGKTAYSFDWRYFGGTEWTGHGKEFPSTRILRKMPASLAVMGKAMNDPYLDSKGQKEFLKYLRSDTEWDLDDPSLFYKGL